MDLSLHAVAIAFGIFLLRICDVSIGTVRTLFTIRGYKLISFCLGVVESAIWIFAISRVMKYISGGESMLNIIGWAFGFATGTVTGITLEKWIGSGTVLVRIISKNHAIRLKEHLHSERFGVTAVQGQGYEGNVLVIFVVSPRRREADVLSAVRHVDPDAFITVEPVSRAYGGFPVTAVSPSPASMKK
ncbi:MAG: DUF2179 domain-containing protein [Anaerolineae bacterium]|nr:DUF2179 domain-containing protein [Phycisphaerae bacterium]